MLVSNHTSGYFYGRKYEDVDFKSWLDIFVEFGGGALLGWILSQLQTHRKHGKAIDAGLVGYQDIKTVVSKLISTELAASVKA